MKMDNHPTTLTAGALLGGVKSELLRCNELLMRIEDEVLPLVSHPIAPTLRAALQDIDLLSQCMDDIARTVGGMAQSAVAPCPIDAAAILSPIRLQDMRLRLEGGTYDTRKLAPPDTMFDAPANASAAATTAGDHLLF